MKPTYEELEAKCQLQKDKLEAINKLMAVIESAGDLAKDGIENLEQQLSESRREFRAADATINNLELKLADMAEQLANAENRIAELESLTAQQLTQQALVVPDEMTPKQASRSYCGEVRGYRDGWNACLAAMLNQEKING